MLDAENTCEISAVSEIMDASAAAHWTDDLSVLHIKTLPVSPECNHDKYMPCKDGMRVK